jgi:cupin superfamily acireductone dioxygenase involved in methionine salvage
MNRHDSFEVIYVYEGEGFFQVQKRRFRIIKGNLAVVGPNHYHQFLSPPSTKLKLSFLHFQSQILLGSMTGEEEQYLAPFLCQDLRFPHLISALPEYRIRCWT